MSSNGAMNNITEHPFGTCRYLDLSTASLPYWKLGQGPDLVFVHGWPIDSRTWRNVLTHLTPHFTCHLFDLPGAGWSRWSPYTPMEFSMFPEVVSEAVAEMELSGNRFLFVGHNSGGGLARMAIHQLQGMVAGYILGNTEIPNDHSALFKALFVLGKTPLVGPAFRMLCQREMTLELFSLSRRWKGSSLERELTDYFVRPLAQHPAKLEAALAVLRKAHASDFDRLAQAHELIDVPVHLVWGKKDRWFPLPNARRMLSGFAGTATLQVVDDASLLVHEEYPELFADAVREMAQKCLG